MSTPGDIFFASFFDRLLITGGALYTTRPTEERLKTVTNSIIITPPGGYISPATRTGLDTSMEATCARAITVSRAGLRLRPHRYLLWPRLERRSRRFSSEPARLRVLVLSIPRLLRPPRPKPRLRVPVLVKRPKLWQQRPTRRVKCLRSAAPESSAAPLAITPPAILPRSVHSS